MISFNFSMSSYHLLYPLFLLLLLGHYVVSYSLRTQGPQHASFPVLHYLHEFAQTHVH